MPHKEAALAVSEPDDRARAVGASNTLWLDSGRLRSTNTDVEGFTANLDAAVPGWERRAAKPWCSGAGGSARAVVYGLIERGIDKIHVVNRTPERAEALRERFGAAVQPAHWTALPHLLARAGLLVNTTSLGMAGQPPLEIDLRPLPRDAVVADLVYAPLETPLLAAARGRGLATADGLGMLLHQAVGVPALVRGAARGDAGTAGRWSRQTWLKIRGIRPGPRGFTAGRRGSRGRAAQAGRILQGGRACRR